MFVALSLTLTVIPSKSFADRPSLTDDPDDQVDIVLLMDSSASMQITDPDRLRIEGAKLLVQFLKSNDRLSIIEFDEEARVIRPLTPYSPLDASRVANEIEQVGQSGRYTNILAGIKRAREMLEENPKPGARKVIILLSDGKMDPNPNRKDVDAPSLSAALLHYQIPEIRALGARVHTLAFSDQADQELLKQIAQASQGVNFFAPTAEQIHEAFAELFLVLKKPQIVPATGTGFRIEGDAKEAIFYVNTEGEERATLISPTGNQYTHQTKEPSVEWFEGKMFDVVTIKEPEAGIWRVTGLPKNEGFATVLSDLKLLTDWPSSILAGTRVLLQARLYDDEKPVVLPEMTGVTRYAFQITPTDKVSEPIIRKLLHDDGEDGDAKKDDGIFSANVRIDEPGEYRLRVLAKGPTFERHQAIPFRVRPRLVTLTVVPVEDSHSEDLVGEEQGTVDYFRVTLNAESAKLKRLEVQLFARGPQGYFELPLARRGDRSLNFEVPATQLPGNGEYELQARISGEGKKKDIVRGESQVVRYTKHATEIEEGKPEVHLVVQEEVAEAPSPILWSVLLVVLNGALGGYFFTQLKKGAADNAFQVPSFALSDEVEQGIIALEQRTQLTELDFNDPIFSDPSLKTITIDTSPKEEPEEVEGASAQEEEDVESEGEDEDQDEISRVLDEVNSEEGEEEEDSEEEEEEDD
ncbi:MAG: VWA domain-containing protein [Bdellovibrionales bacterium]|nr:VWA domain-containing protein [Bdellovibrionales bacterium]